MQRLLLFTGDGKGKSTAAFGMALRARGHGQKAMIIQFIKSDAHVGELATLKEIGVEVVQTGLGFVPDQTESDFGAHVQAVRSGLDLAANTLSSGDYDLVALDEICVSISRGLITTEDVIKVLSQAGDDVVCVLTGRGTPDGLIEMADTVTEMKCVKHGYDSGMEAIPGVEF